MYFATFFQKSAISEEIVEACGDRSVLILDGRWCRERHHLHCKVWAETHGFYGYQICKGGSLLRNKPITDYVAVSKPQL